MHANNIKRKELLEEEETLIRHVKLERHHILLYCAFSFSLLLVRMVHHDLTDSSCFYLLPGDKWTAPNINVDREWPAI